MPARSEEHTLNSSHLVISYAVFCLKKKKKTKKDYETLHTNRSSYHHISYHFFFFNATPPPYIYFFFFNDTATTEIYTLSLHDALPISDFGLARVVHADHTHSGEKIAGTIGYMSPEQLLGQPADARKIGRAHSELQSPCNLVCRLLLEKKKKN